MFSRPRLVAAPAVLLVACTLGFAVRLGGLADSAFAFHPIRQYFGIRLARAYYFEARANVPAWERLAAEVNEQAAPHLEPRILERIVVTGYRMLGREVLWLGGLISALLWVISGVALFLIARRLASDLAGMVAVIFFLFLPYSIVASRTFQPDPAMVACMLAAILAVLRHDEHPRPARLLVASCLSGLATFIKPTAAFFLLATFTSLAIHRRKLHPEREASPVRSLLAYLAATLLVPGVYVGYGLLNGNLSSNFQSSIAPRLWLEGFYWRGWLHLVNSTVGSALAVGALAAVLAARKTDARATILGLWIGYFCFGLVFSYHIHTHDYYHLPLVPIVALSLGIVADAVVTRLRGIEIGPVTKGALAATGVVVAALIVIGSVRMARPGLGERRRAMIARDQQVGELVGHSTKAVLLAPASGSALRYHGSIAGPTWPSVGDKLAAARVGRRTPTSAERLDDLVRRGSEWFIVTNFSEWTRQGELKSLLAARATVAHRSDTFIIYDLRRAP